MTDLALIEIPKITNEDLTQKTVDGTGTFDIIMSTVKVHLKEEYTSGRITGQEYTKAYIQIVTAALSGGIQFLLGRDQAYWQAILAQQQAKNALIQEDLIREQMETARAQTLDTRSDGVTTVVGAIGKQKALYNQQITSYQRDAEVKAAKLFTDAWITQKTLDEGLTAPLNFQNASIDAILADIKTANNIG